MPAATKKPNFALKLFHEIISFHISWGPHWKRPCKLGSLYKYYYYDYYYYYYYYGTPKFPYEFKEIISLIPPYVELIM